MTSRADGNTLRSGRELDTDEAGRDATLLREIDLDRRSVLRDERYGTSSTYMSEHQTGTVFIRVSIPELKIQKCLQFELDESVWEAKQRILTSFAKDLRDPLNYGLYLPPMNGRAGKFLEEERTLREYPLHGPIGFLEFKYKRRVYKLIHLNPRKLKQLHSKTNFRQFVEHVKNGNLSKINKLTNKGLDPNFHDSSGETPLTYAVNLQKEKCREVIISLVSGGAHIDFRSRQGQTPAHKAVLNGNLTGLQTLLDLGASTNYKDCRGLSPLYYSILYSKNPMLAEMLLHERAIVGTRDEQGWYEIHQACKLGLVQHLEHLLFYGADLDVQNASGNTALHVCAVNNNEQCARVLLFRGADKDMLNYSNQSAQQVAILAGNVALADLIKNHENKDVVPFREMPTFSKRRQRQSMYSSTLSLISRSRSDPKLNISSAIDDSNVTSPPSSMRSLPQVYPMYPDYGSYPASRGSDSPRSLSISSNSSGPGDVSIPSPRPPRATPSPRVAPNIPRHHSYAGHMRYETKKRESVVENQLLYQQEVPVALVTRGSLWQQKIPSRHATIEEESPNGVTSDTDDGDASTNKRSSSESEDVFMPAVIEEIKLRHGSVKASMKYGQPRGSPFSRPVLEERLTDQVFVCVEEYHPTHPTGLWIDKGDIVEVVSVSDTGYWEGSVNDRDGWFPAHHVQEVRLRNKAVSLSDLLGESRESTLMNRNTLAALVRSDASDYGPRTVVLQRAPEGYGFVLRGAKSQLKPNGDLDFRPTPEFPALQYLDSVDPGSASDRAGLKAGDFILEINGENVVRASHDRVVHLIRGTGDTLAMKVVTVRPASRTPDWFQQDKSLTMPNRKKKAAPAPPHRDPRTSLSYSRSEGQSVSDEIAAMEKLDMAIGEEKKTASIRSRTAAKRVSVVQLENLGVVENGSNLERSKSTPDLLDPKAKAIYATPTVPNSTKSNIYAVPGVNMTSTSTVVTVNAGTGVRPKTAPPVPPAENTTSRKQAPKPPQTGNGVHSKTEVVSINRMEPSPYASTNIQVKNEEKAESPYESSFRPGVSAKLSDEPASSDQADGVTHGHKRTSSSGAILVKQEDEGEKHNVSFAEDKVMDNAANFLKKHPNAQLLITSDEQSKVRNRTSRMYEPAPDYDEDSGEDRPSSPVRSRNDNRQSVTVISVGDKKEANKQQKRYTIHSTIPSEDKSSSYAIPPRPDGPAPTPPNQSPRQMPGKSVAPPPPNTAPPLPESAPPPLPATPPPDFDESPRSVTSHSRQADTPPAPPPAPPVPTAPPAPPPPPPPPTVEDLKKQKSDARVDAFPIPQDAIAAAVAKRQERIEKEGYSSTAPPKLREQAKPPMDNNQAAILAAVANRRKKLEQESETSVIDAIENKLQKTKKLQAARFNIAGSKNMKKEDKVDNKPNNVAVTKSNTSTSVQSSVVKQQSEIKLAVKNNDKPAKEINNAKPREISVTVKSNAVSNKSTSGMTEIKPKFGTKPLQKSNGSDTSVNSTTVNSAKVKLESLKMKPKPLETTKVSREVETKSRNSAEINTEENSNGQSNFLALAEKKRQEWLQRKQKSPSESKSSTPRSSTAGSPELFRGKTIEITTVGKKDGSPPVLAKPKANISVKGATTDHSYTEFQSPRGLVKVKSLSTVNGDSKNERNYSSVPPPPPGFRDGIHNQSTVVQLEIIPPPANFSSTDSSADTSHQHSPVFSPDNASVVSSLSTLSSLSGDQTDNGGLGNGYEDLIAPPPPGFDDDESIPAVIPPPPEFGNVSQSKKSTKSYSDKTVDSWLCNDVLDWLDSLNMRQYKTSFQQNCIDGKKLLSLTRNNYIDLGVTQVGHRMTIERSIKKAAMKQSTVSKDIIASEHL